MERVHGVYAGMAFRQTAQEYARNSFRCTRGKENGWKVVSIPISTHFRHKKFKGTDGCNRAVACDQLRPRLPLLLLLLPELLLPLLLRLDEPESLLRLGLLLGVNERPPPSLPLLRLGRVSVLPPPERVERSGVEAGRLGRASSLPPLGREGRVSGVRAGRVSSERVGRVS